MLVTLLLVLLGDTWVEPLPGDALTLSFPVTGPVTCEGLAPGAKAGRVRLVCRRADGATGLQVEFFGGSPDGHSYIRLAELHPAGMPGPLLLAVAVNPGGSDAHFESALVGEVRG